MIEGQMHRVNSNGSGVIDVEIPPSAKNAFLVINSDQSPFQGAAIPVKIGYLDPIDLLSGQKARLNNLGYFAGDPDLAADDDFRSAVEEFQCDQGLTVDGQCGAKTQAKLKQIHGC